MPPSFFIYYTLEQVLCQGAISNRTSLCVNRTSLCTQFGKYKKRVLIILRFPKLGQKCKLNLDKKQDYLRLHKRMVKLTAFQHTIVENMW